MGDLCNNCLFLSKQTWVMKMGFSKGNPNDQGVKKNKNIVK